MEILIGVLIVTLVASVALIALPRGALRADTKTPVQYTLGSILLVIAIAAVMLGTARHGARANRERGETYYTAYFPPDDVPQLPFDAVQWKNAQFGSNADRVQMVNDVLANHVKQAGKRAAIVTLLGEGEVGDGPTRETYILKQLKHGASECGCLRITFNVNDAVEKCELVIIPLTI